VAAHFLHLKPGSVSIVRDAYNPAGELDGHADVGRNLRRCRRLLKAAPAELPERDRRWICVHLIVIDAGPRAEQRYHRDRGDKVAETAAAHREADSDDTMDMFELASALLADEDSAVALMAPIDFVADRILETTWNTVQSLAQRLLAEGRLERAGQFLGMAVLL
jgi:hypothetical protein